MVTSTAWSVLEPSPHQYPLPSHLRSPIAIYLYLFSLEKKITAFLQTPIKDEGEGVPSWEKKIDIKLWSVEDVLIVGGRWEGLHFMEKNREVDRFFFRRQLISPGVSPGGKKNQKNHNSTNLFLQFRDQERVWEGKNLHHVEEHS